MRSSKLETFVWLARLGNFRAVAERLSLTQPAITQRISALESDLGVPLFVRGSRGITLTPKGREILPYAEQHLAATEQILMRSRDPGVHFDAIRLGVVETVAHVWLDALLSELHERLPALTLELMVDSTTILHDYLTAGELDAAFLLGPVTDARLADCWLCTYPLVWVAGPHTELPDRMTLEQLAHWPIMTYSRRSQPYRLIDGMLRPLGKGKARISASSSLATMLRVVKQGIAVSALPHAVVSADIKSGTLRSFELEHALPPLEYVAAYPLGPAHPLVPQLIEIASRLATASMASDKKG
jgi:DNA-binding transcriptional LysR family regulator